MHEQLRRGADAFEVHVDGDHSPLRGQMTHLLLAEQRLADTPQTEQRDVVRPAALQVCRRLRQEVQLVNAVGEYFQGGACAPLAHGVSFRSFDLSGD